jgi:hypothetical protein
MHIRTNLHYESDCILSACVCAYDRIAAHIHTDVNRRTPFVYSFTFSFSLFNMTATYRLQLPLLIITYVIFSSPTSLIHAIDYGKQSVMIFFCLISFQKISCSKNQSKNCYWTQWYQCISGWNNSISLYCFQTIRCYRNMVLEWFLYIRQNTIITTWNNLWWFNQYLSIYRLSKISIIDQWTS